MITAPDTFEKFWPLYLNAHRDPRTRTLHVMGTFTALACAVIFLLTLHPAWAIAVPVSAYAIAWLAHALYEKNRPMTFSHPLWSLRGDLRMVRLALAGRLDQEAARVSDAGTGRDP